MDESTFDDEDIKSEIMQPVQEEIRQNGEITNLDDLKDPLMDDEMEEEEEEEEDEMRNVQITIKPNKKNLKLILKYTPGDVDDPRNFELPIRLAGIGQLDSLSRIVRGVGVKPRFLMEKTIQNFGKKVIAKGSKPLPHPEDIHISNPDHTPLTWSLNKSLLDSQKVF